MMPGRLHFSYKAESRVAVIYGLKLLRPQCDPHVRRSYGAGDPTIFRTLSDVTVPVDSSERGCQLFSAHTRLPLGDAIGVIFPRKRGCFSPFRLSTPFNARVPLLACVRRLSHCRIGNSGDAS